MENKKVVQWNGVFFGGNANNGANCGFLYANTNNAPSNTNANIGSRLYFLLNLVLSAAWQKCCAGQATANLATKTARHWPNDARQPGQAKNKSLKLGLW